jgi:hypothetical protein
VGAALPLFPRVVYFRFTSRHHVANSRSITMRKTAIRKPSLIISIVAYWLKDGEEQTFTKLCSLHQGHPAHMNIYEDVFFNFTKSDLKDCHTKTAIFPDQGFGVLAYTVVGERTA